MPRSLAPRLVFGAVVLATSLAVAIGPAAAQTDEGDLQDFCRARLALEEAFRVEDFDAATEATGALVAAAPAAVADAAETIAGIVATGDPEGFESEEGQQAQETLDAYVIANCGFRVVPVTGVDYAFEGIPKEIEAGIVAFQFANAAEEEDHELLIFKLKPGVKTKVKKLLRLPEDEVEKKIEFAAAAFASAGNTEATIAELEPGRYLAVCFVPVGNDEDNKPHWHHGMLQQFRVTDA